MLAVTNTTYGPPEVLELQKVERPKIRADQILVQVHAADVTQGDRRLRAGDFPGLTAFIGRLMFGVRRPRHAVGGTSFAGRVVEVGAAVTRFAVGDDVFGGVMRGAYAQFVAVGENEGISKMPTNTTYAEAASLPYGAGTALVFLRDMAKVQAGERVLIVGATGGVGRMAVQIAKHLGAHVTGVGGRDDDGCMLALGADVAIDYRHEDFLDRDERWDVILDTTEGNHFARFKRAMTSTGRYLSLYLTLRIATEMLCTTIGRGPRAIVGVAMGTAKIFEDVRCLVEQGALRAVVAERFSLRQIADAHAYLETERPRGSVVVDVADVSAVVGTSDTRTASAHIGLGLAVRFTPAEVAGSPIVRREP